MIVAHLLLELFKNKIRPVSKNHPVYPKSRFDQKAPYFHLTTKEVKTTEKFHSKRPLYMTQLLLTIQH